MKKNTGIIFCLMNCYENGGKCITMRSITELPAWERLFKRIIWEQIGEIKDKYILDFGSGEGVTADHFAENNNVIAVEPWEAMLENAWRDHAYRQIIGDVSASVCQQCSGARKCQSQIFSTHRYPVRLTAAAIVLLLFGGTDYDL